MGPLTDDSGVPDPRRFLVTTDRLAIYSGVYDRGEVITDAQAGSACERLLELGALIETTYNLTDLPGFRKML